MIWISDHALFLGSVAVALIVAYEWRRTVRVGAHGANVAPQRGFQARLLERRPSFEREAIGSECRRCGGPVDLAREDCRYCGTPYVSNMLGRRWDGELIAPFATSSKFLGTDPTGGFFSKGGLPNIATWQLGTGHTAVFDDDSPLVGSSFGGLW